MRDEARLDKTLALHVQQKFNGICDGFEAAWKEGARPRIEAFLTVSAGLPRAELLRELLLLELSYRCRLRERPVTTEYEPRFPLDAALIRAVFSEFRAPDNSLPEMVDETVDPLRDCRRPPSAPGGKPEPVRANADRNLLLGILALQLNFIDRNQLVAAFDRWTSDKSKPLGEILVEIAALDVAQRELLDALVVEHLRKHGNDPEKSLAAVAPVGTLRDDLQRLADSDVEASLARVAMAPDVGSQAATFPWTAGASTSSGTRFRVLRRHARGGLGEVYVAEDQELHREVALKEIREQHAHDSVSRARFLLEAEVTGGLEHPNIVPVYGLGSYADGRPFYAMRFVKGDSLKDAIKRFHDADQAQRDLGERRLKLRELLGRFIDVCNAVEYAHSRGILHRDLKPGNIMLGKYGETLVVDWGLAKALGQRGSANDSGERTLQPASAGGSAETQMGSAIGTPQYMSPEQAEGRIDELGPATDVYSLGATLYCLLAGRAPFPDAAVGTTVKQVSQGDFPPPQRIKRAVPMALQAVCLKAMSLKSEERYLSARSLADDVEHWLADEAVSVYREPLARRVNRWVRNHKGTTGAVAAAAIVLLVASAVGLTLGRRANERVRALEKADALCTVRADGVPFALDNLRPVGRLALERLREHFTNPQADATQRLHAAFGLADLGETPTDFLLDAIPAASGVECRNLVAALAHVKEAALSQLTRRVESAADAAEKARHAIVALHLGDPHLARDALAVRSDPIDRTTLIHAYAAWHGDLIAAADLLRTSDSAFRSGLCAAFGTIAPESLESHERDQA
ncbi:MAG TPA: serine/threonine-protein kinase, partial [Pirellulales bacterium]|nr:serine/threonine-protein kinase [Pirellulales bacterium]